MKWISLRFYHGSLCAPGICLKTIKKSWNKRTLALKAYNHCQSKLTSTDNRKFYDIMSIDILLHEHMKFCAHSTDFCMYMSYSFCRCRFFCVSRHHIACTREMHNNKYFWLVKCTLSLLLQFIFDAMLCTRFFQTCLYYLASIQWKKRDREREREKEELLQNKTTCIRSAWVCAVIFRTENTINIIFDCKITTPLGTT